MTQKIIKLLIHTLHKLVHKFLSSSSVFASSLLLEARPTLTIAMIVIKLTNLYHYQKETYSKITIPTAKIWKKYIIAITKTKNTSSYIKCL